MNREHKKNTKEISPEFSVVIPIYNEEENIPELYRRLITVMDKLCIDEGYTVDNYEIIMVDDGSKDNSWQLIKNLHNKDTRVKGISFSRNFGHHVAVLAGIDHLKGNYAILMDGDLQDQPEEIPKLIAKTKEGYDIIQGVTLKRHLNPIQNIFSKTFNKVFTKISTVDPKTRVGLFRCLTKPVVESIKKLPERAIFFGGIVSWVGFKTAHVPVNRVPRYAGKSKYNFLKRFGLATNAIISFSEKPLIFIFQLGIIVFLFSISMFGYAIVRKIFYNVSIIGWTSIFAAIFFSTGLITLSLSIVGLYISKLFIEIKQRPKYIIKENIE
ncbi:MAG: glycosyltransferase family 2 protein [Nitrospirae bacterium]|nr:glycosyltransferase family 2 protein [Nitrospirota bacterium]